MFHFRFEFELLLDVIKIDIFCDRCDLEHRMKVGFTFNKMERIHHELDYSRVYYI